MTDRIGGFGKKLGDTRTDSEKTPAKPTPRATQLSDQAKKRHTRVPSLGWQKGAPSGEQGEAKPETPRFLERDRTPDVPPRMGKTTNWDSRLDAMMREEDFDHETYVALIQAGKGAKEYVQFVEQREQIIKGFISVGDVGEVNVEVASIETVVVADREPTIPRLKMPTNEEPQSTGVELPSVDAIPEIKTARPDTTQAPKPGTPRMGHKRTGSDRHGEQAQTPKKMFTHKRFVTDLSALGDGEGGLKTKIGERTPRTPRQTPSEKAAAPLPNAPRKPWPITPSTPRAEVRTKPQDSAKTPREDVKSADLPPIASPVDRDDPVISPRSNKES